MSNLEPLRPACGNAPTEPIVDHVAGPVQGEAQALKAQAQRCRRLASTVGDPQTVQTLTWMAADYEDQARGLNAS